MSSGRPCRDLHSHVPNSTRILGQVWDWDIELRHPAIHRISQGYPPVNQWGGGHRYVLGIVLGQQGGDSLCSWICLAAVYEPEFASPWQILMFGARVQILNSESGLYKTTKGRLHFFLGGLRAGNLGRPECFKTFLAACSLQCFPKSTVGWQTEKGFNTSMGSRSGSSNINTWLLHMPNVSQDILAKTIFIT